MARILSIAAELSAPPSSPTTFREVTMVAATARGYEVVAVCEDGWQDSYNRWFRRFGLWDYLSDLLPEGQLPESETTIAIVGGHDARLTAFNLHDVLRLL